MTLATTHAVRVQQRPTIAKNPVGPAMTPARLSALLSRPGIEASTALIRANDLTGGMLRAPYAARLEELSAWIIDARRDGQTTEAIRAHVDSWLILTNEAEFVTVERTARKLSRWATHYAQNVLLDSPEDDVKVKRIIGIRLRDWVRDPDAAMKLVREDPLIGNGDVGNIYDDADYRVE